MTPPFAALGSFNGLAVGVFAVFLVITLVITRWASRRTRTTSDFWTAGRSISGAQNGTAVAGDFLSASSFLGYAGLMFLFGFDGIIIGLVALASFIPVLYLLAERMRNSGKFTLADVLSFRLRERPVRAATAITTLVISGIYLVGQLVGAGVLLQALAGVSFPIAVILCGVMMVTYVAFGGMLATTWVQIIKAVILMVAATILAIAVLAKFSFDPSAILTRAVHFSHDGPKILGPGLEFTKPLVLISTGVTIFFGTAGLPHILMKFFTVRDARAARVSMLWTIGLIGIFTVLIIVIGFGSRAVLGPGADASVGDGGNLAAPLLAQSLGGGSGTVGGEIALALFSAAAFATILAVVAGLVIAASAAIAHDIWANVLARSSEAQEAKVARIVAVGVGVSAVIITLVIGSGFNVTLLISLAFVFSASANFPALVLALYWRRFNTAGALTGVAFGMVSSLVMIILSPTIWPGAHPPSPLTYPALITMPIGFLGCVLGTVLSGRSPEEHRFTELLVRSETGIGAEQEGKRGTRAAPV